MKKVPTIRVSATFVAEPLEPALRFWLSAVGLDSRIEFAPYNQVFQELLQAATGTGVTAPARVAFVRLEDWLTEQQTHETPAGSRQSTSAPAVDTRYRLPNGIEVAELNRSETDHLYREIFQNRAYLRHGVQIDDSAVIVDCGANIGMFSLFAHLHARDVRIVAVEPGPRVADVLRTNAALHGMAMTVVEAGLSDRDGEAAFTFYENYSIVSGFDAGHEEDESFLRAAIRSTIEAERPSATGEDTLQTLTDYLVQERLRQTQMIRPVRRLGRVLREQGIGRVDLLKIDVEKAELQVLDGLDEDQWPTIQQIVMEIHDRGDAIARTVSDLERRGFTVVIEEERDLKNTGVWNLFAVRPDYVTHLRERQEAREREILRNVRDLADATRQAAAAGSFTALVMCPASAPATARAGHESLHATAVRMLQEGTAGLSNVAVVDAHDAARTYACENYYDWRADVLGHMPYSVGGYGVLGTIAARTVHTWARSPFKVVVVDCDNTLWSGVAGEDGPQGIVFGPAHRRLHTRLAELQQAGVLLALNSKNEPADVWAVFDGRPDFALRRDQFVTTRLNWLPKSENLRSMAAELNLGLDSFVFLDDNPVECAEVGAHTPDVTVLPWPADSERALRFLDHAWALDIGLVTDEDRKRTSMYQQEAARRQLRDTSMSLEAFLNSLELEVTIAPVAPAQIPRAAQLTQRTNQFNFTTIRRSEDDIRRLIADGADVRILHVKDRFGDYGLVGLAVATRDVTRSALVVDTFLMSCRVLGKGVEHRLLAALGTLAEEAGLASVELQYQPTSRNRPAWMFATSVCPDAAVDASSSHTFAVTAQQAAGVVFKPSVATEVSVEDERETGAVRADVPFRPDYQRIATELTTAAAIVSAVHPIAASSQANTAAYEPPTTDVERTLARIWGELLRLDRVGVRDNFFAIGGDSIVGIQVLSRAAQAGLALEMRDLFEYETIAELARAIEKRHVVVGVEAAVAPGTEIALTPIQRWFFEKRLPAADHWNMEMVVLAAEPIDSSRFIQSLQALLDHHDALRYRYLPTERGWLQRAGDAVDAASLVDVVTVPAAGDGRRAAMAAVASRLHATLDLARGVLLRAAVCVAEGEGTTAIVLVAHHLVCDGVTWRVLLEDLDMAYGQLTAGEPVSLPRRSTSYATWAEKLTAYAGTEEARAEFDYWRAIAAAGATPIACDRPDAREAAFERTLMVTPSVIGSEQTRVLLQQAPQAFDSQVNDVLLAALAVAYRDTFGTPALLVDLEGHGREPLFDDVNLSRTVGWFTTVFPVHVDACGGDLRAAVTAARALRRAIPRRGIGYGLLRYLHPDRSVRETLASAPQPEVMFNYLGQFDQVLGASARFSLSPDVDFGPLHGPDGLRSHLFEIIGRVVGGELRLDWMYSAALFEASTVTRLIANYERALAGILALVRDGRGQQDASPRTAAIAARLGGRRVSDVYGLAPIQRLFLVALDAGQSVGLDQWRCRIDGSVDTLAFRHAWDHLARAHGVMRTAFVSDLPGGPAQAVLDEPRLAWHEEDLSSLDASERAERIRAYLAMDRQRLFDPLDPPLMRVALFKLAADRWEMVWTFHHLLIDGWSCPLVFTAVGEAYDAILDRRQIPAGGSSYAGYVEWLERHPAGQSESFWRRYLAGFTTPTTLPRTPGASEEVVERSATLPAAEMTALTDTARRWRVSINTLIQLAWALVLSRQAGKTDVVFGVAFAGRPADLPDVESIIGPFVNNLPVRASVDAERTLEAAAKALQAEQFELLPHQTTPLPDVQRWSDIEPGARLFESLLVLQSYVTAAGLGHLGRRLSVTRVDAPVRTNYPLTVIAVPSSDLTIRLVANPRSFAPAQVERLLADLVEAVRALAAGAGSVAVAAERLSVPTGSVAHTPRVRSTHPIPPRPGLETTLAGIWQRTFGLNDIGVNESFTDLGGQSLLMIQIHAEIQRVLGRSVSIVALFQHPTIRGLAAHLEAGDAAGERAQAVRNRAARQAEALARQPGRRRP